MFLAMVSVKSNDGYGGMADVRFRRAVRCSLIAAMALTALLLCGCRATQPSSFPASLNSPRAEERVRAAKQAVNYPYESPADRFAAIELLVGRLDDEDEAVRFFAILALEKMTGTRLGYKYHDSVCERLRAIDSWWRYLAEQVKAASKGDVPDAARPKARLGHSNVGGGLHP